MGLSNKGPNSTRLLGTENVKARKSNIVVVYKQNDAISCALLFSLFESLLSLAEETYTAHYRSHRCEVFHMKISGNTKCLEISTHRKKSLANYLVTIQLHDYPSCANSKNLVLVKHFVGGK